MERGAWRTWDGAHHKLRRLQHDAPVIDERGTAGAHLAAWLECKRLGLQRIRLHDLQHMAARLWYDVGYQTEVVSKLIWHSSTNVTSTIYMHVTG